MITPVATGMHVSPANRSASTIGTLSVASTIGIGVGSIGFSIGSALAGLLLGAATPADALLPREHGYLVAAL